MASPVHNMTTRNTRNRILQPQTYQDVADCTTMQWSCGACTLKNPVTKLLCDACGSRRYDIPEVEAVLVVVSKKMSMLMSTSYPFTIIYLCRERETMQDHQFP